MQHVTIPASVLDEGQFEDGHAFDGSSVRGFQQIQESDMVLVADPNDRLPRPVPARQARMILHCFVADPVTGEQLHAVTPATSPRRPRSTSSPTGIADTAYFGPEPEFFIFDDVRFATTGEPALLLGRLGRGQWNTGARRGPNLGYKPRTKEGYFPAPPMDHYQDLRSDMAVDAAARSASTSSCTTTRWPPAGRARSASSFDTLLRMADKLHDVQVRR